MEEREHMLTLVSRDTSDLSQLWRGGVRPTGWTHHMLFGAGASSLRTSGQSWSQSRAGKRLLSSKETLAQDGVLKPSKVLTAKKDKQRSFL